MKTLDVQVWRGDKNGSFEQFEAPAQENQTVLDVVTWIQRNADPSLSYRFACRVGMCGSCAMTVNGRPRWTCRTHVSRVAKDGKLKIEPLLNLPIIKDLASDLKPFFDKWNTARGTFEAAIKREDPLIPISPDQPERAAANAAIECINCAVCYSACDMVSWKPSYLGPAALNRAWAAWNDVRNDNRLDVLKAVSDDAGCHNCHSHQSCSEHCPVGLNPTTSIAGLKRATSKALLKGDLK